MKKKLTLLSTAIFSCSVLFGQGITGVSTVESYPKKNGLTTQGKSISNHYQTKAEGDIIWSSDFSTPTDWSVGNNSTPSVDWVVGTAAPTGEFSVEMGVIASTSGGNFALFDSDGWGSGTSTQNSWIGNANPIDLTGNAAVLIQFESYYRAYAGECFVEASTNGTDWTTVQVHQDIPLNSATENPVVVQVNMSGVIGGSSTAYIRFRYQGAWDYAWMIDDVNIIEAYENDVALLNVYSIAGAAGLHYTKFPVSQVDGSTEITFGGDIINDGSTTQNLTFTASNASGYTFTTPAVAVAPIAEDSLSIESPNGFLIPATAGVYDFTMTVAGDQPFVDPSKATKVEPFEVTSKVMAVDRFDGTAGSYSGAFTGWANNALDPGIGADFEIFEDAMLERVQVGVYPAADPTPYIGNGLFVQLFKFTPGTGYEYVDISLTHEVQASDFGTLVNVQFENPVSLQAGDIILPVACFFSGSEVPIALAGFTLSGTVVGVGDGGMISLASDGDLVDAPVVRLDFGTYLSVEDNVIESSNVSLYPNPASNNATIAYSLNEGSDVAVEIRDMAGKLVYSAEESNVAAGSHTMAISTSAMAEGMYTYTLVANGSKVTKKFVVKK